MLLSADADDNTTCSICLDSTEENTNMVTVAFFFKTFKKRH